MDSLRTNVNSNIFICPAVQEEIATDTQPTRYLTSHREIQGENISLDTGLKIDVSSLYIET